MWKSSVSAANTSEQPSADQSSGADRSSVILAPARLDLTATSAAAETSTQVANTSGQTSVTTSTSKPNNYFSNNFGHQKDSQTTSSSAAALTESRLQTTTNAKTLLRPSVLRFAPDSSTSGETATTATTRTHPTSVITPTVAEAATAPKENKTFAFVSLSKEDIARPATTLLQSDSIIRCGADTTSPFNGEEAPGNGQQLSFMITSSAAAAGHTSVVTSSTSSTTASDDANNGMHSEDSNSQTGFVFGQNLEERAVVRKQSRQSSAATAPDASQHKKMRTDSGGESGDGHENGSQTEATTSTAGNEMSVIRPNSDGVLDLSSTGSGDSSPDKSKEGQKRKYEVITGEEDEQNVLSMHCRLYAWESDTSTWKERGRGNLRLNDAIKDDKLCSRIVMRTSGALRVILNAHLVSGMRFDMSNQHCLRFTNVDGIYLIKGAPKDIDQLNSAIDYRLRETSKRAKTSSEDESEDLSLDGSVEPMPQTKSKPILTYQKSSIDDIDNEGSL